MSSMNDTWPPATVFVSRSYNPISRNSHPKLKTSSDVILRHSVQLRNPRVYAQVMFDSKTSFYILKPHLTQLRIYAEKTWQAQCCRYWGLIQFMQALNHTEKWTFMKGNSNSSWLCVAFDGNTLKQCMCYWHCFPSFIADFLLFARTDHSSS